MAEKKYLRYKEAAEKAKIRILDIYRGRDSETVRFVYRGRVYVVSIRGTRDNYTPEAFVEELKKAVKQ
mgnify:CR=1 FL=1